MFAAIPGLNSLFSGYSSYTSPNYNSGLSSQVSGIFQSNSVDNIKGDRITQRQELFKQLSDTELAIKMNIDSQEKFSKAGSEAQQKFEEKLNKIRAREINPENTKAVEAKKAQIESLIEANNARRKALNEKIAELRSEYGSLMVTRQQVGSQYHQVSNQYNPYQGAAKMEAYTGGEIDADKGTTLAEQLNAAKQKLADLDKKFADIKGEKTKDQIMNHHNQKVKLNQDLIKLQEEYSAHTAKSSSIGSTGGHIMGQISKYTSWLKKPPVVDVANKETKEIKTEQDVQDKINPMKSSPFMLGYRPPISNMFSSMFFRQPVAPTYTAPQPIPAPVAQTIPAAPQVDKTALLQQIMGMLSQLFGK